MPVLNIMASVTSRRLAWPCIRPASAIIGPCRGSACAVSTRRSTPRAPRSSQSSGTDDAESGMVVCAHVLALQHLARWGCQRDMRPSPSRHAGPSHSTPRYVPGISVRQEVSRCDRGKVWYRGLEWRISPPFCCCAICAPEFSQPSWAPQHSSVQRHDVP